MSKTRKAVIAAAVVAGVGLLDHFTGVPKAVANRARAGIRRGFGYAVPRYVAESTPSASEESSGTQPTS